MSARDIDAAISCIVEISKISESYVRKIYIAVEYCMHEPGTSIKRRSLKESITAKIRAFKFGIIAEISVSEVSSAFKCCIIEASSIFENGMMK